MVTYDEFLENFEIDGDESDESISSLDDDNEEVYSFAFKMFKKINSRLKKTNSTP